MCQFMPRVRSWCVAVSVLVLTLSIRSACADTRPLLDALEQRIVQFPTLQIAWKVVQIEPGRSPMGYTTYEMLVDGDRFRIVRNVEGMADPMNGSATSFKNTFTDDGTVQHNFVSDFSERGRTPTGNRSFKPANGATYSYNDNVLPMLLYFRPNAIRLHHFDISESKVTTVENDKAQIFSEAGRHDTLWQSASPFALLRWEFVTPETQVNSDRWTTTIDYASASETFGDESDAVIPVAFKVVRSSPNGNIRWIKEVRVTAYSSRPEVRSDAFVIDYPEGTPVINGDNPEQTFVVRADKTFRPVSANDSRNYGSWLNIAKASVDPEVANLDERRGWSMYLFVGAVVALAVFGVRRFRRITA